MLLDSVHKLGTVKDFIYGGVSGNEGQLPDFIVVKVPQFWEYDIGNQNVWKRVEIKDVSKKIQKNAGQ